MPSVPRAPSQPPDRTREMDRVLLAVLGALLLAGPRLATCEWVEIPQFSDYRKVYRPPLGQRGQQHPTPGRRVYEISRYPAQQPPGFSQVSCVRGLPCSKKLP